MSEGAKKEKGSPWLAVCLVGKGRGCCFWFSWVGLCSARKRIYLLCFALRSLIYSSRFLRTCVYPASLFTFSWLCCCCTFDPKASYVVARET